MSDAGIARQADCRASAPLSVRQPALTGGREGTGAPQAGLPGPAERLRARLLATAAPQAARPGRELPGGAGLLARGARTIGSRGLVVGSWSARISSRGALRGGQRSTFPASDTAKLMPAVASRLL
jgi:hypothetical protein